MRAERRERLFRWLPLVCERAGIPYAYTLTIWSAGALCIRRFGLPSVPEVFLFAVGGTVGYGALALGVRLRRARSPATVAEGSVMPCLLWENVVALPAIAVAAGVSAVVPEADANFLLVPLTATITYLAGLAMLVSVTARCAGRSAARRTCPPSGRDDRDDPSRGVGRPGEGQRRACGM